MDILLLRPDRAGDAIKTLPALRSLVSLAPPDWNITLLCSVQNGSCFTFESGVKLITLPSQWESYAEEALSDLVLRLFERSFDLVLNLLCDVSPSTERLLSAIPATRRLSIGRGTLSLPDNTAKGRDEIMNIALLMTDALGRDLTTRISSFSSCPVLSNENREEATTRMGEKKGQRWLGICPFSGPGNRAYPLHRWIRFLGEISRELCFDRVFIFGEVSHFSQMQLLQRSLGETLSTLCFPTSFRALGAYFERLEGLVAIDSGPLHLAQALRIPTLGLLSGGDNRRWFPRLSNKDHLIRRGLFSRFPGPYLMQRGYRKWLQQA